MLIDPIAAFAATKSAISLIQQGIKVGKDLTELASPIMKWAEAESHIDTHSSNKGKSMLGKFSSIEQNAIAAHLRKFNNYYPNLLSKKIIKDIHDTIN